jgi:hypothetical protein
LKAVGNPRIAARTVISSAVAEPVFSVHSAEAPRSRPPIHFPRPAQFMASQIPPLPRSQHNVDQEHLNLLSIFHFVCAGLAVFGLLFLFAHYTIMHSVFMNPKLWENQKPPASGPPPAIFFKFFLWFYVIFGVWFIASGVLNLFSGFFLRARKRRTFSLVTAAINCLHIPLGTVLGVFTILVLSRESVRQLYQETDPVS